MRLALYGPEHGYADLVPFYPRSEVPGRLRPLQENLNRQIMVLKNFKETSCGYITKEF